MLFEFKNNLAVSTAYQITNANELHTLDEFVSFIERMDVEDFARFKAEYNQKRLDEWAIVWVSPFMGEITYSIIADTVIVEDVWCEHE